MRAAAGQNKKRLLSEFIDMKITNVSVFILAENLYIGQQVMFACLVGDVLATIIEIKDKEAWADSDGSRWMLEKQEDGSWHCQLGFDKSIVNGVC